MIVVTEAGNMMQEKIIHVVVSNDPSKMTDVVRKTLQEAEVVKLDSVAFPALGTGKKRPYDFLGHSDSVSVFRHNLCRSCLRVQLSFCIKRWLCKFKIIGTKQC